MGPLPNHWGTLPSPILIESQVFSSLGWSVSRSSRLDIRLTSKPSLLNHFSLYLQYILKLIPCSELSFRGPKLGPHQLKTRIRDYVLTQKKKKKKKKKKKQKKKKHTTDSHFNRRQRFVITYEKKQKMSQLIYTSTDKQGFEFTYSCRIPVDVYINCGIRQTRFLNLVKPNWSQINGEQESRA